MKTNQIAVYILCGITIIGGFIAKISGYNGTIDTILIAVTSFFLGLNLPTPREKDNASTNSN